jgi:hypothetical protein
VRYAVSKLLLVASDEPIEIDDSDDYVQQVMKKTPTKLETFVPATLIVVTGGNYQYCRMTVQYFPIYLDIPAQQYVANYVRGNLVFLSQSSILGFEDGGFGN